MRQNIDESTDWLEKFHEGQRLQRQAMSEIKSIYRHLRYAFPHIADDLQTIIQILEKSEKLTSKAINQNMSEAFKSSQDFVDLALTGIMKACEKEYKNE